MNRFKTLEKSAKIRFSVFIALIMILSSFIFVDAYLISSLNSSFALTEKQILSLTKSFIFDEMDLSFLLPGISILGWISINAVVVFFSVYYMISLVIMNFLVWLIFKKIVFRRMKRITKSEYHMTQIWHKRICIAVVLIAGILSGYVKPISAVSGILFTIPMIIGSWYFYCLQLEDYLQDDPETESIEESHLSV